MLGKEEIVNPSIGRTERTLSSYIDFVSEDPEREGLLKTLNGSQSHAGTD